MLEYAQGELDAAAVQLERAFGPLRIMAQRWAAECKAAQAHVELAQSRTDRARQRVQEALSLGRATDDAWALGMALEADGAMARVDEPDRAEDALHDALDVALQAGGLPGVCDALDGLAGAVADQQRFEEGARLLGAARALRESIGYVRFPVREPSYLTDVSRVRESLGTEAFEAAWAEGAALSMDDAVAYARRGRGERKRPSHGWNSLTPTEHQIVDLVSEGLTNPQIGDRLFISKRTVQTHLIHVFAKLGVSTRAELAASATRRRGSG